MKNNNTESTRYYSSAHEQSVAKELGGTANSSSGSGHFQKGDVIQYAASLLVECKCTMTPKSSVSIRKECIEKNKEEVFSTRLSNSAVCINFEPGGDNYYLINSKLMKFLVEKLIEEGDA